MSARAQSPYRQDARARVEHVFAAIRIRWWQDDFARSGRRDELMTMMAACYNLKRLGILPEGRDRGPDAKMGRIAGFGAIEGLEGETA